MAERQLPKLNVAGSIPVSRSNSSNRLTPWGFMRHTTKVMKPIRLDGLHYVRLRRGQQARGLAARGDGWLRLQGVVFERFSLGQEADGFLYLRV